jgi:hypothetical protein
MKESRPEPVRCNNVTVLIAVFTLSSCHFVHVHVHVVSFLFLPSSFSQSFIAVPTYMYT